MFMNRSLRNPGLLIEPRIPNATDDPARGDAFLRIEIVAMDAEVANPINALDTGAYGAGLSAYLTGNGYRSIAPHARNLSGPATQLAASARFLSGVERKAQKIRQQREDAAGTMKIGLQCSISGQHAIAIADYAMALSGIWHSPARPQETRYASAGWMWLPSSKRSRGAIEQLIHSAISHLFPSEG